MPYYFYDNVYFLTVIPALIISLWAQIKVKSSFAKYSKKPCHLSGLEAAQKVLFANGVTDVRIEMVSGNLTDHYDPKANVIRLSESVCHTRSIAAVGVAAHEAGHAVQYATGYSPIRIRAAILPLCQLGSNLSMPLLLFGLLFSFYPLVQLGILFFCATLLFQLVTLPVEFNASRRAMNTLRETGILSNAQDVKGARSVLSAAAMTYVASVIVSVLQLLRLLALAGRRRN